MKSIRCFLPNQVANDTVRCRDKIEGSCKKAAYCTGDQQTCPDAEFEDNGTPCGDKGMYLVRATDISTGLRRFQKTFCNKANVYFFQSTSVNIRLYTHTGLCSNGVCLAFCQTKKSSEDGTSLSSCLCSQEGDMCKRCCSHDSRHGNDTEFVCQPFLDDPNNPDSYQSLPENARCINGYCKEVSENIKHCMKISNCK